MIKDWQILQKVGVKITAHTAYGSQRPGTLAPGDQTYSPALNRHRALAHSCTNTHFA